MPLPFSWPVSNTRSSCRVVIITTGCHRCRCSPDEYVHTHRSSVGLAAAAAVAGQSSAFFRLDNNNERTATIPHKQLQIFYDIYLFALLLLPLRCLTSIASHASVYRHRRSYSCNRLHRKTSQSLVVIASRCCEVRSVRPKYLRRTPLAVCWTLLARGKGEKRQQINSHAYIVQYASCCHICHIIV